MDSVSKHCFDLKCIRFCSGSADSGGPLVCFDFPDGTDDPYLCGIVSWGVIPCGQELFPSVYSNPANPAIFQYIVTELARP